MKRIYIILIIISICCNLIYSQKIDSITNKGHYFSLETGYGYFRIKDITESPMIYGHSFMPLYLSYRYNNDKSIHELNILYFKNVLESSITKGSTSSVNNICASFGYSFLKNSNLQFLRKSKLFFGSVFITFFSYRNHNFGEYRKLNGDIFTQISFKIKLVKNVSMGNKVIWDCSLPVFGYVMLRRYNYGGLPDGTNSTSFNNEDLLKTGELLFINKFVDLQSRFQYERQLNNHWYFNLSYLFRYYHYYRYKDMFPVKAGINVAEIGLKFKL